MQHVASPQHAALPQIKEITLEITGAAGACSQAADNHSATILKEPATVPISSEEGVGRDALQGAQLEASMDHVLPALESRSIKAESTQSCKPDVADNMIGGSLLSGTEDRSGGVEVVNAAGIAEPEDVEIVAAAALFSEVDCPDKQLIRGMAVEGRGADAATMPEHQAHHVCNSPCSAQAGATHCSSLAACEHAQESSVEPFRIGLDSNAASALNCRRSHWEPLRQSIRPLQPRAWFRVGSRWKFLSHRRRY